jgi:hypothetical protein
MFDGKAFGSEMVEIVKRHVAGAMKPLISRIDALEKRAPERGEKGEAGADGKDGLNGADGALGRDGVDGKDGSAGIDGKDGAPGEKGIDGKDGIGLAGALIDREGRLVVTLTDGTTRDLGPVVGKDGAEGLRGSDGKDGRDGADGLGFDDLEVVHDGVRGFTFRFARGEQVKEFPFTLPVVIDKGVFKDGSEYEPGDGVTWAGSFWIAQEKTAEKPDSGRGWRLAVKRGRDGKRAPVVSSGPKQPLHVGVPAKAN